MRSESTANLFFVVFSSGDPRSENKTWHKSDTTVKQITDDLSIDMVVVLEMGIFKAVLSDVLCEL
jgi:hypothetical protein